MKKALRSILFGWYFFVAWEGRVTRWDFISEAQCLEARGEVVRVLSASHLALYSDKKVTKCLRGLF